MIEYRSPYTHVAASPSPHTDPTAFQINETVKRVLRYVLHAEVEFDNRFGETPFFLCDSPIVVSFTLVYGHSAPLLRRSAYHRPQNIDLTKVPRNPAMLSVLPWCNGER
jgi:hypothetical protein